jgi:valyl-tRNA synthetase
LGQDLLFDEQHVELGRNFCNKLWNACRFRQMQGGEAEGEINPTLLSDEDKWILLKLDRAIQQINEAFAEYRFSEVVQVLYRFFWGEYCDWYVESTKAVLTGTDAARKANTLAVIDFVLSNTLRLFHPFLPYITEDLWHGMGYSADLPEGQGGKTIMNAAWPAPLGEEFRAHYGLAEATETQVDAKHDFIVQGRNLRREANLQSGKKVKYVLKSAGEISAQDLEVMRLLLNADPLELTPDYQPPKGTPSVHSALGDLYLPLAGLVDTAAEKARLTKALDKIQSEIDHINQRLGNPAFTAKAPPQVLEDHRQRLAEWQAKQKQTQAALEALAG